MKQLNLVCERNRTSYGYHACYTAKYLCKAGVDVATIPIIPYRPQDPDPMFTDEVVKPFHHDADCLKIWHQHDLAGHTGRGNYFAFSAFELEDLNDQEIYNMKYPDIMLVPTKWAVNVCAASNVRAYACPLGYEPELFSPKEGEMDPSDWTVFGNFGKWEVRKGHDILIDAFNAAFEKDDNVTLAMMPHNFFIREEGNKQWADKYLRSKLGSKIEIIPRMDTQKDVSNVMRQIHCAVFPARAEGWNLEALECMALGKDVIITNCTGHTEFVDNSCRLIDMPDEFERAYDGVFFHGVSRWRRFGKQSFEQLVEHLRAVHKNRGNRKLNNAAINRASEFTWEKSINVLQEKIS